MANPMVSVVVPCFNSEGVIRRFLDSILSQTYHDIELIVVNDGSTDSTESILSSFEAPLTERGISLTVIHQANQGIGGAINAGLKPIAGRYFTWLNSDDVCDPEYIATLVGFLDANPEYSAVRSDAWLVHEDDRSLVLGRLAAHVRDRHRDQLFENAVMEVDYHFGHWMVRVDEFDRRNPRREIYPSRQGQNWQLTLPLLYDSRVASIDSPLYTITVSPESVSRAPGESLGSALDQISEYEKILNLVLAEMAIPDLDRWLAVVSAKYMRSRMRLGLKFNDRSIVRKEFASLRQSGQLNARDVLVRLRSESAIFHHLLASKIGSAVLLSIGRWWPAPVVRSGRCVSRRSPIDGCIAERSRPV